MQREWNERRVEMKQKEFGGRRGTARTVEKEEALRLILKGLDKAVHTGTLLRSELAAMAECLGSAESWGTLDLLGGRVMATAAKHRRMEEARHHLHVAGRRLHQFEKELKDLSLHHPDLETELELIGAMAFADRFPDGLIVEWIVQGRVERVYQQVEEKLGKTAAFLLRLGEKKAAAESELQSVQARYVDLLDDADDRFPEVRQDNGVAK